MSTLFLYVWRTCNSAIENRRPRRLTKSPCCSFGQINATSFDSNLLESAAANVSASFGRMKEALREEITLCTASPPANLKPRQQAVFSYLCTLWTLFLQCDDKFERHYSRLHGESFQRRTRYLSGNCPLSPTTLRNAFRMKNPSWANCSEAKANYTEDAVNLHYDEAVSRAACYLKNFETANGLMDIRKLITSMNSTIAPGDKTSSKMLEEIVGWSCRYALDKTADQEHIRITPEGFAKCMAENGVYSCVRQEAMEVARNVPETCSFKE